MENNIIPKFKSPLVKWISYIKKLHNRTIDMNLERVSKVAMRLDILRPAPFIFIVTGTNGKGTTCCMIEAILIAAGYRVGVYNSPHLVHYTERVRVQNAELPEYLHTASFAEIEAIRGNISLTYFEYSTLSALWLFKQAQLDVVVLEVGMGGRLDATNIVDADVAVITNVALDHTIWLGSDRESIGREKAGIFRTGKPAIIGETNIPKSILYIAQEKQVRLLCRDIDWYFIKMKDSWLYNDKNGKLANLPLPRVPQSNAATALSALRSSSLKINKKAICEGIQNAILPGRFQIISGSPRLILDVAHNPHAATYLVECIKSMPKTGRILAVIGMLKDKDIANTLICMDSVVDNWYYASLKVPRGASAKQLIEYLGKGKIYENVMQAWHAAMMDAYKEDTVLVCGSFYTVAPIIKNNIIKKEINK